MILRGMHASIDSSAHRAVAAQLSGSNIYCGAPCYKCGGTIRYIFRNRCKNCKDADNKRRAEKWRRESGCNKYQDRVAKRKTLA